MTTPRALGVGAGPRERAVSPRPPRARAPWRDTFTQVSSPRSTLTLTSPAAATAAAVTSRDPSAACRAAARAAWVTRVAG